MFIFKMKETIKTIYKSDKIHFYVKIYYSYNKYNRYKKNEYYYDILDNNKVISTHKHNKQNKPAVIEYYNGKITKLEYWKHGKLDRKYAPAIIILDGKIIIKEQWFHDGIELSDNEIKKIKKVIDRRKKMLKLIMKILKK